MFDAFTVKNARDPDIGVSYIIGRSKDLHIVSEPFLRKMFNLTAKMPIPDILARITVIDGRTCYIVEDIKKTLAEKLHDGHSAVKAMDMVIAFIDENIQAHELPTIDAEAMKAAIEARFELKKTDAGMVGRSKDKNQHFIAEGLFRKVVDIPEDLTIPTSLAAYMEIDGEKLFLMEDFLASVIEHKDKIGNFGAALLIGKLANAIDYINGLLDAKEA